VAVGRVGRVGRVVVGDALEDLLVVRLRVRAAQGQHAGAGVVGAGDRGPGRAGRERLGVAVERVRDGDRGRAQVRVVHVTHRRARGEGHGRLVLGEGGVVVDA